MPVTTIDDKTALIVVDLQKGLINSPFFHPLDGVIERSCILISAFRQHRLPVVLVNVAGGAPGRTEQPPRFSTLPEGFSDLLPALNRQPGDIVVTKRTWGAFATTDLETQLKEKGITQVVVVGVATGTGVEATARQAYEQGFNVTLAIDAMTDTRPEAHAYSLSHVFPRLGETGTTEEIINLLPKGSLAPMNWLYLVSYFFGGIFLANAIPHLVSGMMGRSFQSPFAKPPGEGLSSSTVNVLWGVFNLAVGYMLLVRVGHFDVRSPGNVTVPAAGALLISLFLARHFGRFHGGNTPEG